jgi:CO/xanthine dehydrogenase FAD-binding subunit
MRKSDSFPIFSRQEEPLITAYHRPKTLQETSDLLANKAILAIPLGGGTAINRLGNESIEVVDLQDLNLDGIRKKGNFLEIGATVTLQALFDSPDLPEAYRDVILAEATHNLRQVATLAGTLVAADGRSPLATAMLALDSKITIFPGKDGKDQETVDIGDLLPFREEHLSGRLITQVTIPLNVRIGYQSVSRTPADRPIVCAAVVTWPSGRSRVALGGFGQMPMLAMDGPEMGGEEIAAQNAFSQATDEWASAEYRQEIAGLLVKRCMTSIEQG